MTDKREPPVSRLAGLFFCCGGKKEGERGKGGEAIALVGNSGTLSTGPHLQRPEQMCYNDFENVLEDKEEGVTEA